MRTPSCDKENLPRPLVSKQKKEWKRKETLSSTMLDEQKPKKRWSRIGNVIALTMDSVLKIREETKEGEKEE